MQKRYAFYSYGRDKEFSDYYFMQNFWYSLEELQLSPDECIFFVDEGNSSSQKYAMLNKLDEIKCIVLPSYNHLNPSRTLFKELYEDKFNERGISLILLDEENYSRESI